MTRAQRFAAITAATCVAYFLVFFSVLTVPFFDEQAVFEIIPVLPWWMLVSFGSYSLWSLGMGLFTFRDCDDAYEELLREINMAKTDLRARGVTVD